MPRDPEAEALRQALIFACLAVMGLMLLCTWFATH